MNPSKCLYSPAAERNQSYIIHAVHTYVQRSLQIHSSLNRPLALLEIASGSGQHAAALAHSKSDLIIQPTDRDQAYLESIEQYRLDLNLDSHTALRSPLFLDVTQDLQTWPTLDHPYDLMLCVNMIHISPWESTEALFRGAATHLSKDGFLITYGPYEFPPVPLAESNQAFHQSLQFRNPEWGIRSIDALDQCAHTFGLHRIETQACPANNHILVFAFKE